MEALDDYDAHGTTGWDEVQPANNYQQTDTTTYTYTNHGAISGASNDVKFYSELANSGYYAANHFWISPVDTYFKELDNGTYATVTSQVVYEYQSQFSSITNMAVYEPVLKPDTEALTSSNVPIYIVFKGTSTLFDWYKNIRMTAQYETGISLASFNTEMTAILNLLSPYILNSGRKIHIVGHSLGFFYGLHLLHNLIIQENPNHDQLEDTYRLTGFNPLILVDDAYLYFRDTKPSFAKTNIVINAIEGDWLTWLFVQNGGIGSVNVWSNDTAPVIDETDFLLGTWLTQAIAGITNINMMSKYLEDSNHNIETFGGSTDALDGHAIIDPLRNTTYKTIKTSLDRDVGNLIAPGTSVLHKLRVYRETANLDQSITYVDYPHTAHSKDHYNWDITRHASKQFILSTLGGVEYINFRLNLTSHQDQQTMVRYLKKISATEYLLMYDKSTCYKITDTIAPDLPRQLLTDTLANFENAGANAYGTVHKNRFKFTLDNPMTDAGMPLPNQRRIYNTQAEANATLFTGLEALFQTPSKGYGFFNIKMIGTTTTNPNYLYMEDGTNQTVYARPAPTSEGNFGISHLDNNPTWAYDTNEPSDEHVWKLSKVAGSTNLFTVQNTAYPTKYFGTMGSVSGTTPALNTPPQILIEEDSFVTTTDYYHMSLKGTNSTDYMAYWYVVNSLYHYVDFNGLNNTNYNISRINFKFEAI